MANPFKHSTAAIKIIKNDLSKIKTIINYVVNIIFVAYCLYFIFSNLDSAPYIIVYSFILCITVATFLLEPKFKSKDEDERKLKRLKKKQRRIVFFFLKSFKYICKAAALIIAVFEISTAPTSDLAIIATILSGIVLILQIIYDFVILLVNRYLDILQIAIEEDLRSSKTLQFFVRFANKDIIKELKEDRKTYTDDELRILEELENEGKGKEKVKAIPVNKELQNAYDSCKSEAKDILNNRKREKTLFKKLRTTELPNDINEFKEVPSLISFVKSYKKRKYSFISEEKAASALASLIYITKKNDLIPDSDKNFGYMDDQVILKKSLDEIDEEYKQFLTYQEKPRLLGHKKD